MMNDKREILIENYSKLQGEMIKKIQTKDFGFTQIKVIEEVSTQKYILEYEPANLKKIVDIDDYSIRKKAFNCLVEVIVKKLSILKIYMLNAENILWDFNEIYVDDNLKIFFTYIPQNSLADNDYTNIADEIYKTLGVSIIKYETITDFEEFQKRISMLVEEICGLNNSKPNKEGNEAHRMFKIFTAIFVIINLINLYIILIGRFTYFKAYLSISINIMLIMLEWLCLNKNNHSKKEDTVMMQPEIYLIDKKFPFHHKINKERFLVGKNEKSNLKILDPLVSNPHAVISLKDNNLYVKDLNSTNHTYVNKILVPPEVEILLKNNDELKFANSRYKLKVRM